MKRFARAAALLLLIFLLSVPAFAADDCYRFTPPEGYTLAEGQTALWVNAAQTANINILVENKGDVNPYDLTPEDIQELRDATAKVFESELAQYEGKVTGITADTLQLSGMPVVRLQMESSYTVETVALKSRQVQYIYFTKEHCIYVTGTVLSDFADAEAELEVFRTAAEAIELHDELYTKPTADGNSLVLWVVIGAILGGAGGLALFLLQQRKKTGQKAEEAK